MVNADVHHVCLKLIIEEDIMSTSDVIISIIMGYMEILMKLSISSGVSDTKAEEIYSKFSSDIKTIPVFDEDKFYSIIDDITESYHNCVLKHGTDIDTYILVSGFCYSQVRSSSLQELLSMVDDN